ncbi:MAG: sialidase family protein [Candidatus Acidiferrales bacterium]
MQRAIRLVVCLAVAMGAVSGEPTGEQCGREPNAPVAYSGGVTDVFLASDCDVIRAVMEKSVDVITIRCPTGIRDELLGFLKYTEFTTTNSGKSWEKELPSDQVPSPLATATNDFAQAPSDPKVLYRYVQEMGSYLRSNDGGQTWTLPQFIVDGMSQLQFAKRFGGSEFYALDFHLSAIDPANPLKLYAGISDRPWASFIYISGPLRQIEVPGMYVSIDGGDTWSRFSDVPLNSAPTGISAARPARIYSQSKDGVVISADGGNHWTLAGQSAEVTAPPSKVGNYYFKDERGFLSWKFKITQIAVDPNDPNVVFLVSNKGVYRSLDGGDTWRQLNLGFDEIGSTHSMAIISDTPAKLVVGTTRGTFLSEDRGCHFQRIYPPRER